MSAAKKYIPYVLAAFAVVLLAWALYAVMNRGTEENPAAPNTAVLYFGATRIDAEVVTTMEDQARGLSGRTSLPEGRGMLFVFATDGKWGFWMKDMLFPIDIIWLDGNGRVVRVVPSLSPDTYPNSYEPSLPARYVLEVPAGFAASHGIEEGSVMSFTSAAPR